MAMPKTAEQVPPGAPTIDKAEPLLPAASTKAILCFHTSCSACSTNLPMFRHNATFPIPQIIDVTAISNGGQCPQQGPIGFHGTPPRITNCKRWAHPVPFHWHAAMHAPCVAYDQTQHVAVTVKLHPHFQLLHQTKRLIISFMTKRG